MNYFELSKSGTNKTASYANLRKWQYASGLIKYVLMGMLYRIGCKGTTKFVEMQDLWFS